VVVIAIPRNGEGQTAAETSARLLTGARADLLVGVTQPVQALHDRARAIEVWRWVRANTPELTQDEMATEEVDRELALAQNALRECAARSLGLDDATALQWYAGGKRVAVDPSRGLSSLVSALCDNRFFQAPVWKNELLNRRALSTAAAAARLRLIEAIFENPTEPLLGLPTSTMPPEKSAYLSVLAASGLHSPRPNGRWALSLPPAENDPCRVRPLFAAISGFLGRQTDNRCGITALFDELRSEPLGTRDGVLPLALAIYVALNPGEVAIYEDETFVPGVDGHVFQRMLKEPTAFEVQWLPASAQHKKLYSALNDLLHGSNETPTLVTPVRALVSFARRLPAYTRLTNELAASSRRVREALLAARDPSKLLLRDLPTAVGTKPFSSARPPSSADISAYINQLRKSLEQLEGAYPFLMTWIGNRLDVVLQATQGERRQNARDIGQLAARISDVRLRGLCHRLADKALDDVPWLESVAAYIAERPPKDWRDDDKHRFDEELTTLSARLERVRLIAERVPGAGSGAVHVYLTGAAGDEVARIVPAVRGTEQTRVDSLVQRIRDAIGEGNPLTLLAATEYLRQELQRGTLTSPIGVKEAAYSSEFE
jgi:hypothetical protein